MKGYLQLSHCIHGRGGGAAHSRGLDGGVDRSLGRGGGTNSSRGASRSRWRGPLAVAWRRRGLPAAARPGAGDREACVGGKRQSERESRAHGIFGFRFSGLSSTVCTSPTNLR